MNFKYYKTGSLVIFILVLYFPCSYLSATIEEKLQSLKMLENIIKVSHSASTLTIMLTVFFFIDRIGWRWMIFKWLVDLPNLNGRYSGNLISSFLDSAGVPVRKECIMEVRQTASKIHISSYFVEENSGVFSSSSHSISEEIRKGEDGFFTLYYIFLNDTGPLAGEARNHSGTASFNYHSDRKALVGEYYNERLNKGTISASFQQKKRLGRFTEEI